MNKILIANRGEIACRIIATARRMGLHTVAVYSDADRDALHVARADEARHIGPPPSRESYLDQAAVIAAARETGADAIHPGYGFLSENAAFADACADAGLTFIGPPAAAIRAMGSKSGAKALMEQAGVPLTPGYHGEDQDDELLAEQAARIGYPVLLKASAGGGGRGMRVVESAGEFRAALDGARREAEGAFGDARMLIERYVARPRHVEVQVFCDQHGNGVYLHERDCSIQRRHQKVVEEAPAPGLAPALRQRMGEAALRAAQAVDYVGAGTIEFLLEDDAFYFMEMNTRLQVEHPVTELVTGLDLVEWQIRIAQGEALPLQQEQVPLLGHAIEVRIYAEDCDRDFMPCPGPLHAVRFAEQQPGIRVDSGVRDGDTISAYYDPMLAKLIAHGRDREQARLRLQSALENSLVAGTITNLRYLQAIVGQAAFARAELSTRYLEEQQPAVTPASDEETREAVLLAALYLQLAGEQSACQTASGEPNSPWQQPDGWRLNMAPCHLLRLVMADQNVEVVVSRHPEQIELEFLGQRSVARAKLEDDCIDAEIDALRHTARVFRHGAQIYLLHRGRQWQFERDDPDHELDEAADEGNLLAPTSGTVVALCAAAGDRVAAGDALLVMEAMKMEHTVRAPTDGTVAEYRVETGDIVSEGQQLVELLADGDLPA